MIVSADQFPGSVPVTRRTTSDAIFDEILRRISSLELKPGEKVSEIDIARQFEVSRQPVREAFIRLAHIELLVIRPQRTTTVSKISRGAVANARFVRLAIELEVMRIACEKFDADASVAFAENLELQAQAITDGDNEAFRALDSAFHRLLCITAQLPNAYRDILECKAKVDRLCALSLQDPQETIGTYKDHKEMVAAMEQSDAELALELLRNHHARLDAFIAKIAAEKGEYLDD